MRTECGVVTAIKGSKALIESAGESFCATCDAKSGCLMSTEGRSRKIWVNYDSPREGDMVTYEINERGVVFSSLIFYLVPVLFLLGGTLYGGHLYGLEAYAALGGFLGLLAAGIFIKIFSMVTSESIIFNPHVLQVDRRG
jgi:positive regulator of sigma E activity